MGVFEIALMRVAGGPLNKCTIMAPDIAVSALQHTKRALIGLLGESGGRHDDTRRPRTRPREPFMISSALISMHGDKAGLVSLAGVRPWTVGPTFSFSLVAGRPLQLPV